MLKRTVSEFEIHNQLLIETFIGKQTAAADNMLSAKRKDGRATGENR